eukprot:Hpha_TRINITY_DN17604_c0_g1::TRINITY_DN17604_c0_g1_i1::g.158751::m.158751
MDETEFPPPPGSEQESEEETYLDCVDIEEGEFAEYSVSCKAGAVGVVKATPSSDAPTLRRLDSGELIMARMQSNGWLELDLHQGWVHSKAVVTQQPAEAPARSRRGMRAVRAVSRLLHRSRKGRATSPGKSGRATSPEPHRQ